MHTLSLHDALPISTANGTAARGDDPEEVSDDATVTTESASAELSITKTADPTSGVGVGDTIEYTVVVKNEGNVTVKAIEVEDSLVTLSEAAFTLEVGAEKTITYEYTVTQADVDAGEIDNTATANGTAARGDEIGRASCRERVCLYV